MNTVAPFLSDHMDPHAFNTLYSMVGEFDRAQRARAMEENQPAAQHPDQTIPGRLSVDSHFNAPAASGHSAARQSFDSSRSFNRRGIGEDGVHRPGSVPHVDLNFNVSWSQEARRLLDIRASGTPISVTATITIWTRMRRRITWSRTTLVMPTRLRRVQVTHSQIEISICFECSTPT
ncbi:hypothetical protein PIB30_092858 [Stylosanthes scabra]|uniref:Uncharacterized protein n=1 Tax=Stylosanthes scabra TaxID=79078 RepID=A0ABU6ZTP6_9FABA|nr:hypothetical protein [Stylosanthes scabra]